MCRQVRRYAVKPLPMCDVSFHFSRCRCRCFNLNTFSQVDDSKCGDDFESGNFPLEKCEDISGFLADDWAKEVRPKIKAINRVRRDYCN